MNAPFVLDDLPVAPERPPTPTLADLAHIPGPRNGGPPFLNTIRFLADPAAAVARAHARYGPVHRNNNLGRWVVTLLGPAANELFFLDRERIFSSALGWNPVLGRVFPRGLMLQDFEEHRAHRKILSVAFKTEPMRNYLGALNQGVAAGLAEWDGRDVFPFYPATKQLMLDLAATAFLGIPFGPDAARVNRAFIDMIAASVGIVRAPLPGTAMWRGVRGRAFLCRYFASEIPKRRGRPGDDIFTRICNATDEDGGSLDDQAIIDHMNFLLLAAHDTLTSSLSTTVYHLAKYPEWQERLRAELLALRAEVGDALSYDRLGDLEFTEMAFKEAVRINSPVPTIPRRALRDFAFMGHRIPAGTRVTVSPMFTHRMPDIWPDPLRFDPLRFTAEASRDRHKYAWVPFGGGAHMCLGLHFAHMQAKTFLFHLLARYRVTLPTDYVCDFQMFPIPRPRDGLPVRLHRL